MRGELDRDGTGGARIVQGDRGDEDVGIDCARGRERILDVFTVGDGGRIARGLNARHIGMCAARHQGQPGAGQFIGGRRSEGAHRVGRGIERAVPPGGGIGERRRRIGVDGDVRRIVDRCNGDGRRGFGRAAVAVGDTIGEGVRTVVVVVRIVFERSIGVEQQRAVGGSGDGRDTIGGVAVGIDDSQRVAIGIGVVGQHIAGDDVVFERVVAVGVGDGRAVETDHHRVGVGEMGGTEMDRIEEVAERRAANRRNRVEDQPDGVARSGAQIFAVGSPGRGAVGVILVHQCRVVGGAEHTVGTGIDHSDVHHVGACPTAMGERECQWLAFGDGRRVVVGCDLVGVQLRKVDTLIGRNAEKTRAPNLDHMVCRRRFPAGNIGFQHR